MKEQMNTCPICHGGNKRHGTTIFTVDLGDGVVVVRDVPAQVCDRCGSDWIDDVVAERLEQIVEQARIKRPMVEIASWHTETKINPIL